LAAVEFMGLNYNDLRCLIEWRGNRAGGSVAMLGRQTLFLHPKHIAELRRALSAHPDALAWLSRYRPGDFADDMFREAFRFDTVTSIDFSDYEGANIIQDIGAPLNSALVGKFDLAIDGGTLEHVFNFPVGIANLMRLARVGGAVYTQNPCNGLAGHGFYQFSPELMYRVFSEQNGFRLSFVRVSIARTLVTEHTIDQPVYEVVDPSLYGGRVNVMPKSAVILMCLAEKTGEVELFRNPVLQSDYVPRWSGSSAPALNWKGRMVQAIPLVGRIIGNLRETRNASTRNTRAFRRVW
jgi:hypothetical protein